MKSHTTA